MKITTAANENHEKILSFSLRQNLKVGYSPIVYKLDYESQKKAPLPFKPSLIRTMLKDLNDDIVWLDSDAFFIKRIDEDFFKQDFDVAVTLRRKGEKTTGNIIHYGYINSGVMFFKHNQNTHAFLNKWEQSISHSESMCDQEGLNMYLLPILEYSNINKIVEFGGIRYLILTTDEYNFYYFEENIPSNTKILHFKGDKRQHLSSHFTGI